MGRDSIVSGTREKKKRGDLEGFLSHLLNVRGILLFIKFVCVWGGGGGREEDMDIFSKST